MWEAPVDPGWLARVELLKALGEECRLMPLRAGDRTLGTGVKELLR